MNITIQKAKAVSHSSCLSSPNKRQAYERLKHRGRAAHKRSMWLMRHPGYLRHGRHTRPQQQQQQQGLPLVFPCAQPQPCQYNLNSTTSHPWQGIDLSGGPPEQAAQLRPSENVGKNQGTQPGGKGPPQPAQRGPGYCRSSNNGTRTRTLITELIGSTSTGKRGGVPNARFDYPKVCAKMVMLPARMVM